jgi:starch synthase
MKAKTQTGILTQFHKLISSQPQLKILIVAPEASPYANVGGIARVIAHLSLALARLGHDVRIFMPKFGFIDEEKYPMDKVINGLKVPTGAPEGEGDPFLICNVKTHTPPIGVPAYFLENMEYYEKRANVYGYSDDSLRWALLSRGAIEFIKMGGFVPDVVHTNDWQTGLLPNYLRSVYDRDKKLLDICTVFTIHNLHYQGMFDHRNISELDFDDGRSEIASFFDERLTKQNFLKRGVLFSDVVSTVSETYSREILTPAYGECLEKLLLEVRSKIFGITNGIDYDEFNPATDPNLANNYDARNLADRYRNKVALQKEFGLKEDPSIPIIAAEGRLDAQKGLDMTVEPLSKILSMYDVQFIALGGGDLGIADALRSLKNKFPDKVGLHLMPNFALPRLIFAGSDIMLFPSRFEPCGLVQMEGMRYGAVPVARMVGGLVDTVKNFDAAKDTGCGFTFKDFDPWQFFGSLIRALEVYNNKEVWEKLVKRCMEQDFSWETSAARYTELYYKAVRLRRQDLISSGQLLPSET